MRFRGHVAPYTERHLDSLKPHFYRVQVVWSATYFQIM
jgi:hypothetical protein